MDVDVAVTNEDFLEFGFTTTTPYELVSMDFTHDKSSTGPNELAFFLDIDGVVATMPFDSFTPVIDTFDDIGTDISINFPPGTMIQSSATIRIVGFRGSATQGTYSLFGTLSVSGLPGMIPCVSKKRSIHEERVAYNQRIAILKGLSRDRKRLSKP